MNKYDGLLNERLEQLGHLLQSRPSVIEGGMQVIEQTRQTKPARRLVLVPALARSGLGLAACLVAGVCLWLCLAGPTNITLAEVQSSINAKPWVLIRYEDGMQEWANLRDRLCFVTYADSRNFYAGMRDHVNGLWRAYHSNWGQQIHEERFTPRPYPQTPWEYATGDWDDRGIVAPARTTVEKSSDTIDGREVVRFDSYDEGPLGLRVLVQQVWADPETRLPVRIRKYRGPDRKNEINTGDFSFPERGPSSIHDLGAPEGLPVVVNWGIIEPAAKTIVDAAKEALRRFPRDVWIVRKSTYQLTISFSLGEKFRKETYGIVSPDHQSLLAIEWPDGVEQIRTWASSHLTLFGVEIDDGQFSYSLDTGQGLWPASADPGAAVKVRRGHDAWAQSIMPITDQWPFISNVGPMTVLEDAPDLPAGCVLLRFETPRLRRDWYVDPARDYICVKQRESASDDIYTRQVDRTDLTRLPSGQWYAKTVHTPNPVELQVRPLSDAEIQELTGENESSGFFSAEKLLKEAMDRGAKVTFWAR
jgi:hypothetical protein